MNTQKKPQRTLNTQKVLEAHLGIASGSSVPSVVNSDFVPFAFSWLNLPWSKYGKL
jgi:hypothetical protein